MNTCTYAAFFSIENLKTQKNMGLNETLNRLAREREARENNNTEALSQNKVREYAERIFFERMLKEINHGMSEETINERIDRCITIARLLYKKLKV